MLVTQLTEIVGMSIRPVQLIQVDIVGLQPLQAGIHRGQQIGAVKVRFAIADIGHAIAGGGGFAGNDPVATPAKTLQVVADNPLGRPVGVGPRRHRVHLGGVDKVDACSLGTADLFEAFGFAVLFSPGHAAQRQSTDLQMTGTERAIKHGELL